MHRKGQRNNMGVRSYVRFLDRCGFELFFTAIVMVACIRGVWFVDAQAQSPPPPLAVPPGFAVPPGLTTPPGGVAVPPGLAVPPGVAVPPSFAGKVSDAEVARTDNAITNVKDELLKNFSYCASEADIPKTYDYTQTPELLQPCRDMLGPDYVSKICFKAEIVLYFASISAQTYAKLGVSAKGNPNCNDKSYPEACNAGFSGGLSALDSNADPLSDTVPRRLQNPTSCCPGFFCPLGLSCMIPCPIGASCPLATFETTNFTCSPYKYKPPVPASGPPICGGADAWVDFKSTPGTFCGGNGTGQYCPDSRSGGINCTRGHYCRTGSVKQAKCNPITKCNQEGLSKENVAVAGILLIVILFAGLLVVYNCSEQAINLRQRRRSRVRAKAAKEARAAVSAGERWKKAKDLALQAGNKAIHVSRELSRNFSRNFSPKIKHRSPRQRGFSEFDDPQFYTGSAGGALSEENSGDPSNGNSSDVENGDEIQELRLLANRGGNGNGSSWHAQQDLYAPSRQESLDLYETVDIPPVADSEIKGEDDSSVSGSNRKVQTKGPRTQKAIYKFAYGQIEKEKVKQQEGFKAEHFTDVVHSEGFKDMMAGKRRRQMDISFVDLSLTLKGSGKTILNNVTGNFNASKVTAVMGPSGAGKTTFLNALAGKETGSTITGQVFINKRPGSMQSYKKVIGFVPQDDIVHGNLTVEENLTFSASYRLPKSTTRADSVLIVERIIQELGLSAIRDSLVGTVESRGISGGQRKRVNVGMELVMEPSLLILDEPTSGLDSTSSRLVMQSLRREALLGANVAVVLHQPSYSLFRMFDDVMFLAKGGFTVYLGPVLDVESYFSSLGFEFPDRINPPDYVMDALEGTVLPANDIEFDIKTLPVQWMCHKGHKIPPSFQAAADKLKTRGGITDSHSSTVKTNENPKSFLQDAWDEFKVSFLVKWEFLKASFSKAEDLSGREVPGFFRQFFVIFKRVSKQKFREPRLLAQDFIILLLAGICVGELVTFKDSDLGTSSYTFTVVALALLVMIASLRSFSNDKLQFYRESSSGINRVAYFLAKDTGDHFNTLIKPVVFLSMFYFFTNPRSTFASNYLVTLALVYCVTGIAYILAIILNPQPAQLASVFIPVLMTLLVTPPHTEGVLKIVGKFSYAYWVIEAYVISNVKRYSGVWILTRCAAMQKAGYNISDFNKCIAILFAYGVVARFVAQLCLVLFNRKQQK